MWRKSRSGTVAFWWLKFTSVTLSPGGSPLSGADAFDAFTERDPSGIYVLKYGTNRLENPVIGFRRSYPSGILPVGYCRTLVAGIGLEPTTFGL